MTGEAADEGRDLEALLGVQPPGTAALLAFADRTGSLHGQAPVAGGDAIARFRAALAAGASSAQLRELGRHASGLDARAALGRFRMLDGEAADILFALALPLMMLIRAGRTAESDIVANRYADVTPQGASGWALLPLYISLQASRAGDEALAEAVLQPSPPRLVAIGGLSGTGKSTLAQLIGARIGRAPGARVLRSDVFRKRLAGAHPETRLPPAHYTPHSDAATYEALFESADDHLACGSSVIVDAVFTSRSERDVVEMLALRRDAPFAGIWLEAPERDRIARVAARTNDASDATPDVVREQSRRSVGDVGYWHRMRVNRPIELIVAAARAILDRPRR